MQQPALRDGARAGPGLYGRAVVFVLLGTGALSGAVLMLAGRLVEDATETLLDERIRLARTAGAFVEARLRQELDGLGASPEPGGADEARARVFDRVFVVDGQGRPIEGPPPSLAVDVPRLVGRAALAHDVVLAPTPDGVEPAALVLAAPLPGAGPGGARYAVATLDRAASTLLVPAAGPAGGIALGLVDGRGRMLTTTRASLARGFQDHRAVLAGALAEGREFRGRCHRCHTDEAGTHRDAALEEILAFAPLPTLPLGLAVFEPRATAIAPVDGWRRRLWQLAGALGVLFVGFTLLAVRSVVRPVRALTEAVRRHESGRAALAARRFGDDEVGELARALERWRGRMEQSLVEAERHRAALAVEAAQRAAQRQHLHAVLRAQEAERRRVARELHDTVAQDLAALRLEIERMAGNGACDATRLARLEASAKDMLETVRRILLDLRPTVLESLGFVPALQWLVEGVGAREGIVARLILDVEPASLALPDEIATGLFRVAQEALKNAVRHGRAEHVFVTLGGDEAEVTLEVEDDGRGFDPEAVGPEPSGRGFGLMGMRERARLLAGAARVTSAPGEGTLVSVRVPRGGADREAI
ncbi:MAG: ATP-binding protein [Myxococcales bacterium]|nr:ATP-binding protein [Myxococcales bacterium]